MVAKASELSLNKEPSAMEKPPTPSKLLYLTASTLTPSLVLPLGSFLLDEHGKPIR